MIEAEDIVSGVASTAAFLTGELLLWVFTFGRHRPRWNFYERRATSEGTLLALGSTWLGFIFWMAVIVGLIAWLAQ